MIEELKEEELIEKVGGRFHLTTLIQKRLAAMNSNSKGSAQSRDSNGEKKDKLECVIQEILEDKIRLDLSGEVVETQKFTDTLTSQFGANGGDLL
ncbi:MAG: DNA-directed RNA polymerase subunit omega [Planctomycetia bacterium]|nr:DNA-directed RNA polymerase subunit omega [Planctomycetia bacterium]